MIYNSLREPAFRTACPTARYPDHHHPGDHPVLLCGAGGHYGCSGRWRLGIYTHIHFIAHANFQPFIDSRAKHTHPEHDTDIHPYTDPDRDTDHHSDQFHPSHLDAIRYADSDFDIYVDHNTSDAHFHIHIDSYRNADSTHVNADCNRDTTLSFYYF